MPNATMFSWVSVQIVKTPPEELASQATRPPGWLAIVYDRTAGRGSRETTARDGAVPFGGGGAVLRDDGRSAQYEAKFGWLALASLISHSYGPLGFRAVTSTTDFSP
jgi:hypothetical protein